MCLLHRGIQAFKEAEKRVVEQQKEQEIGGRLQSLQREKVGVLRLNATEDGSQRMIKFNLVVFTAVKVPVCLISWELQYPHVAVGCSTNAQHTANQLS